MNIENKKSAIFLAITLFGSPAVLAQDSSNWGKDVTSKCANAPENFHTASVRLIGDIEEGKLSLVYGEDDQGIGGHSYLTSQVAKTAAGSAAAAAKPCEIVTTVDKLDEVFPGDENKEKRDAILAKVDKLQALDDELTAKYEIAVANGETRSKEEWYQNGGAEEVDFGPADAEPGLDQDGIAEEPEVSTEVLKETGTQTRKKWKPFKGLNWGKSKANDGNKSNNSHQ